MRQMQAQNQQTQSLLQQNELFSAKVSEYEAKDASRHLAM